VRDTISYIESRATLHPRLAVVLGSGLAGFLSAVENRQEIPYPEIPGWPASTVPGHPGKLVFGSLGPAPVAILAGRSHLYEGLDPKRVTLGVRVLAALGVKTLILTNAAGAIREEFTPGSLVALSDHVNLQGTNPLIGPNDDSLGPRFPDMSEVYSPRLRALARSAAAQLGFPLREGVYAAMLGPSYETPAEIRFLRTIGCDLVGMSTVPEAIAARHAGLELLAISCVTNWAAGVKPGAIHHADVLERGSQASGQLARLLQLVLQNLAATDPNRRHGP
jgi:purine-nucleoside phosphorylase